MSIVRICSLCLVFATAVAAQGKEGAKEKPKRLQPTRKYENADLNLTFAGIYGWQTTFASGAGAWSELARYSEPALNARVSLLIGSNSFGSLVDLRNSIEAEFKEGGTPAPGKLVYKEVAITETGMRRGAMLPAIQVEAYSVRVTKEGKKREERVMSRTYFGTERLYRVHCTVRRSRAKRVEDLFVRALGSLTVSEGKEKVVRGTTFQSGRGKWLCTVPDGYRIFLPPANWNSDMVFDSKSTGLRIAVYSFEYDGVLEDQLDELYEYYGDDLKMNEDTVSVLGADGFEGSLEKDGTVTLISGTLRYGRIHRVHTSGRTSKLAAIRERHAKFIEGMEIRK